MLVSGMVLSTQMHIATSHFDLASLSERLYFLRIEVEGKRAVVQKLVVAMRYWWS